MRFIFFFIFMLFLWGCVKEDFCIQPGPVALTMNFKTYNTSMELVDTPLVNASVYNTDTSFLFADNIAALTTVNVAPKRNQTKQTYVVHQDVVRDTIEIFYTEQEVFISNGCGYQTYFAITNVDHTRYSIDSVNIINARVDNVPQNPHLEVIYK